MKKKIIKIFIKYKLYTKNDISKDILKIYLKE